MNENELANDKMPLLEISVIVRFGDMVGSIELRMSSVDNDYGWTSRKEVETPKANKCENCRPLKVGVFTGWFAPIFQQQQRRRRWQSSPRNICNEVGVKHRLYSPCGVEEGQRRTQSRSRSESRLQLEDEGRIPCPAFGTEKPVTHQFLDSKSNSVVLPQSEAPWRWTVVSSDNGWAGVRSRDSKVNRGPRGGSDRLVSNPGCLSQSLVRTAKRPLTAAKREAVPGCVKRR